MTPSTSCAFHTAKISRAIWRLSCVPVQPCVSSFGSPGTLHHGSPQPAGEGRNGGARLAVQSRLVKDTGASLPVMRRGYASRLRRSTIRAPRLVGLLSVVRSHEEDRPCP